MSDPSMVKLSTSDIHRESLCYMSENGHCDQLKECLSKKFVDVRTLQFCLLECSMAPIFSPSIALLLLDRFSPDEQFNFMDFDFLFCRAIDSQNVKLVKTMLGFERTDPSCNENYPISTAAKISNSEIMELLFQDHRVTPELKFILRMYLMPYSQFPAAPQPQQPGLFANMASTAAGVAVGSTVGHVIGGGISSLFGGGNSHPQTVEQPAAPVQQQVGAACEPDNKAFMRCLDANQNNISAW
ncbi:hypothetical protein HDV01_001981 [Terramyces sp. JEL0728]|nr:hypothetical protein HDV01_001981 [Terramyces sp. JEL0728]